MIGKLNDSAKGEGEPLITLSEVEKFYGRQRVLNIENFNLYHNDFVVLKGANGAGKSTLLKLLAGVVFPSAGKLQRSTGFKHLHTAFVPQTGGLISHLSVMENIEVMCRMYGRPRDISLLEQWYIQDLDLTEHLHKPIKALSGGFQKIAAIASACAAGPDGLFIDEPFNGLDSRKMDLLATQLATFAAIRGFVVITNHQVVKSVAFSQTISLTNGCRQ